MKAESDRLLVAVDFAGTFVFAAEGALTAISADLDLFGVMVLAFATALGGGIIRDLLLGDTPPQALRDWRYAAVSVSAAILVFLSSRFATGFWPGLIIALDAAGLALFSVAGTEKALAWRMQPFIAILLGTITGVGGGTVRDVLLARVPVVLRAEVYATAALAGSVAMIGARKSGLSQTLAGVCGGLVCFVLRMASVWGQWNLPRIQ